MAKVGEEWHEAALAVGQGCREGVVLAASGLPDQARRDGLQDGTGQLAGPCRWARRWRCGQYRRRGPSCRRGVWHGPAGGRRYAGGAGGRRAHIRTKVVSRPWRWWELAKGQPPGQMGRGAVHGEDAVSAPQPARRLGGRVGEHAAMDAEEKPAADLAAGHPHRGPGDGIVVGREKHLLPALAPQFGERQALALQPGARTQGGRGRRAACSLCGGFAPDAGRSGTDGPRSRPRGLAHRSELAPTAARSPAQQLPARHLVTGAGML